MNTSEAKQLIEKIAAKKQKWLNSGPDSRRSLEIILGLNSQDTHFILELIQNADDALKGVSLEQPAKMSFDLEGTKLTVRNWGKPFDKRDVIALSSVGLSRKGPEHIGHFGIGFKSVFRVCQRPEVHSGVFSFTYDADTMIIPENILSLPPGQCDAPTTFILNLRDDNRLMQAIRQQIEQLDPRVLLFLPRLRIIAVNGRVFERREEDDTSVLTADGETSRWRVYQVELKLDETLRDDLRQARGERAAAKRVEQIAVAFKLSSNGQRIDLQRKGKVFAFLPTSHELPCPFDLQGDFEVNAERTLLVNPDTCRWNRWLLENTWRVFDRVFKDCHKGFVSKEDFCGLLPNSDDLKEASENVRPILAAGKPSVDHWFREGERIWTSAATWATPQDTLLADKEWIELFPDSQPKRMLVLGGLCFEYPDSQSKPQRYASPGFHGRGRTYLKDSGVGELLRQHVIPILDQLNGPNQPLEWHDRLMSWLANFKSRLLWEDQKDFLAKLKSCAILPTTTGNLAASEKDDQYVLSAPMDEHEQAKTVELFRDECLFLDPRLVHRFAPISPNAQQDDKRLRALQLLQQLAPASNVRSLYERFVEPVFSSDKWKSVPSERLLKLTQFVKSHYSEISPPQHKPKCENSIPKLKLKSQADTFAEPSELYFTTDYDGHCPFDKLIDAKDRLLSAEYLSLDANGQTTDANSWREFFLKLGVNDHPRIIEQTGPISLQELQPIARNPHPIPRYGSYKRIDYELDPAIRRIFEGEATKNLAERAVVLVELLDRNWAVVSKHLDSFYAGYTRGDSQYFPPHQT